MRVSCAGATAAGVFDVQPLGLVTRGPMIYLVCCFRGYQEPRTIALSRLEAVDMLEKAAPGWPGISHKRGQALFETGERDLALERFLREPVDSRHREAAMAYAERILKGLP